MWNLPSVLPPELLMLKMAQQAMAPQPPRRPTARPNKPAAPKPPQAAPSAPKAPGAPAGMSPNELAARRTAADAMFSPQRANFSLQRPQLRPSPPAPAAPRPQLRPNQPAPAAQRLGQSAPTAQRPQQAPRQTPAQAYQWAARAKQRVDRGEHPYLNDHTLRQMLQNQQRPQAGPRPRAGAPPTIQRPQGYQQDQRGSDMLSPKARWYKPRTVGDWYSGKTYGTTQNPAWAGRSQELTKEQISKFSPEVQARLRNPRLNPNAVLRTDRRAWTGREYDIINPRYQSGVGPEMLAAMANLPAEKLTPDELAALAQVYKNKYNLELVPRSAQGSRNTVAENPLNAGGRAFMNASKTQMDAFGRSAQNVFDLPAYSASGLWNHLRGNSDPYHELRQAWNAQLAANREFNLLYRGTTGSSYDPASPLVQYYRDHPGLMPHEYYVQRDAEAARQAVGGHRVGEVWNRASRDLAGLGLMTAATGGFGLTQTPMAAMETRPILGPLMNAAGQLGGRVIRAVPGGSRAADIGTRAGSAAWRGLQGVGQAVANRVPAAAAVGNGLKWTAGALGRELASIPGIRLRAGAVPRALQGLLHPQYGVAPAVGQFMTQALPVPARLSLGIPRLAQLGSNASNIAFDIYGPLGTGYKMYDLLDPNNKLTATDTLYGPRNDMIQKLMDLGYDYDTSVRAVNTFDRVFNAGTPESALARYVAPDGTVKYVGYNDFTHSFDADNPGKFPAETPDEFLIQLAEGERQRRFDNWRANSGYADNPEGWTKMLARSQGGPPDPDNPMPNPESELRSNDPAQYSPVSTPTSPLAEAGPGAGAGPDKAAPKTEEEAVNNAVDSIKNETGSDDRTAWTIFSNMTDLERYALMAGVTLATIAGLYAAFGRNTGGRILATMLGLAGAGTAAWVAGGKGMLGDTLANYIHGSPNPTADKYLNDPTYHEMIASVARRKVPFLKHEPTDKIIELLKTTMYPFASSRIENNRAALALGGEVAKIKDDPVNYTKGKVRNAFKAMFGGGGNELNAQ